MKDGWKAGICGTARGAAIVLALAAVSARAADPIVRPALSYSKTFGGSGTDVAMAVATDAAGNVYVSGYTNSADFPERIPIANGRHSVACHRRRRQVLERTPDRARSKYHRRFQNAAVGALRRNRQRDL